MQPRTTCDALCIGSTPAWHWMQPELFASAEACDWSMRFGRGRAVGTVMEKFGGKDVAGPYPVSLPSEAPSTKLQAPKKHQAPSTKQQIEIASAFGAW